MARILFVSEVTDGGSPRSQRELALQLRSRGHSIEFLVTQLTPHRLTRRAYDLVSDASVALAEKPGAHFLGQVRNIMGSRVVRGEIQGLQHHFAKIIENALPQRIQQTRPDAVVVSSVDRWTWRRVRDVCIASGTPVMLYIREDLSLGHVMNGWLPDILLANAEALSRTLTARGHECYCIPSVVDVSATKTLSSRRAVLAINPDPSRGADIFWAVAARLPSIPFVMQEAWPLQGPLLDDTLDRTAALPNVQFRRRMLPGSRLYGDAKLLMVPYRVDNRPRVVLEAQANGIPVVVSHLPALIEAVGDGGVSVPLDDIDAWVETIEAIWNDDERYAHFARAARDHSQRPEVDPSSLTDQFEELVALAIKRAEEPSERRSES